MKMISRILSLLMIILIVSLSVVPMCAQDSADEERPRVVPLYFISLDYVRSYRFEEEVFDDRLECDTESAQELLDIVREVQAYCDEATEGDRVPTTAEIEEYYKKLEEAAGKVILVPQELKYLIDLCKLEKNDDLYYPSELWTDFQDKIAKAEQVYNIGETTIEVSNAYWDLLYAFSELCMVNTKPFDVDFDGKVTVMDATLVQKCAAQMCSLNSSQLTIIDCQRNKSVNVLKATKIQRILAGFEEDAKSNSLEQLQQYGTGKLFTSDKSNDIFYYYRDEFMPYNGLDQDNLHKPNVP